MAESRKLLTLALATWIVVVSCRGADLVWPTPNPAFSSGRSYGEFVQPTVSGKIESGMFGCVRNDGRQFHEGMDLKPVRRDKRGEASDPVFAILPGIVRHTSAVAGNSSFGRYVVVEHVAERPAIVSLYAHLLSIAPAAGVGSKVEAGQTLGIMGRSAAGYSIPKDRAHVHVETGLWLSERFQQWYDAQEFGSRNEHGVFNGMNIVGFDFLDFVERHRAREVANVGGYLARLPTAATIVVRSHFVPDFVRRYPSLRTDRLAPQDVVAWRIDFTWFALPKNWTAVGETELQSHLPGREVVAFHDQALLDRYPCQGMIRMHGGHPIVGPKARDVLDILFTGE